jgi:peroxiredoxin
MYNTSYNEFDKLEYTPELDISSFQSYTPLRPLQTGQLVTGLQSPYIQSKFHPFFDENLFGFSGHSFRYIKKPLLLYFYSSGWGEVGLQHLKQLQAVQQDLLLHNTNILVVHSGNTAGVEELKWRHQLQIATHQDNEHHIAQLLGLYAEQSPAWSKYPGIETNIPLPAVYVLDHERRIAFDYPNAGLETTLPVKDVFTAVANYTAYELQRKSA